MMKELFYFMFSVYKRSKEEDSLAYDSAILCLTVIRFGLFTPLLFFFLDLTIPDDLVPAVFIIYGISCWFYSKKKAPPVQRCLSKYKKKYNKVRHPKLLMFLILDVFIIGGAFGGAFVSADIVARYGLKGWLLQFLPHINWL